MGSGTPPAGHGFPRWSELSPPVRGGLTEQLAAQQLRTATGGPTVMGQVHHWRRQGGRNAEIDYLVEIDTRIVPVEVKTTQSERVRYQLLNLPHYLTWRLPPLLTRIR